MLRRQFMAMAAATPLTLATRVGAAQTPHPMDAAWSAWKDAYLDPGGRVIDRLQAMASHSEGQGYGMVLATEVGDEDAFDAMLGWTREHLAVRDDALLAWRWLPDAEVAVPDRNNASDGDLFFGWALSRAARVFNRPDLAEAASRVAADLAEKCLVSWPGVEDARLLLPGAFGFDKEAGVIVNPSYYCLRAMTELGTLHGAPELAAAAVDGERLLSELAQAGPMPDWVQIAEDRIGSPEGFSSNSGYEALRVPLWLIWSGLPNHAAVARAYTPGPSSAVDVTLTATVVAADSGEVIETSTAPGYAAIASLTACAVDRDVGSAMPPFSDKQPYYPATLQLFAYLAQMEVVPECFPI